MTALPSHCQWTLTRTDRPASEGEAVTSVEHRLASPLCSARWQKEEGEAENPSCAFPMAPHWQTGDSGRGERGRKNVAAPHPPGPRASVRGRGHEAGRRFPSKGEPLRMRPKDGVVTGGVGPHPFAKRARAWPSGREAPPHPTVANGAASEGGRGRETEQRIPSPLKSGRAGRPGGEAERPSSASPPNWFVGEREAEGHSHTGKLARARPRGRAAPSLSHWRV